MSEKNKKVVVPAPQKKREFTKEFNQEAVQMTLDGLAATVVRFCLR